MKDLNGGLFSTASFGHAARILASYCCTDGRERPRVQPRRVFQGSCHIQELVTLGMNGSLSGLVKALVTHNNAASL